MSPTRNNLSKFLQILPILFVFILTILLLIGLSSGSDCSSQDQSSKDSSNSNCINLLSFPVPLNSASTIIGSVLGSTYTFLVLYYLDKLKLSEENKNKAKLCLNFCPKEENREQYIVNNENHIVYLNQQNYSIGRVNYVRIKVKNEGNKSLKKCRAYLEQIEIINDNDNLNKIVIKDFIPLLWAYEDRNNNSEGINITSESCAYVDIFVSYPEYLIPAGKLKCSNTKYLKLKTKIRDSKYDYIIEFPDNENKTYKIDIVVTADDGQLDSLSLKLSHMSVANTVSISTDNNDTDINLSFYLPNNTDEDIINLLKNAVKQSLNKDTDEDKNFDWQRVVYELL